MSDKEECWHCHRMVRTRTDGTLPEHRLRSWRGNKGERCAASGTAGQKAWDAANAGLLDALAKRVGVRT